ncbi:MAG: hypothetical protein AVDCRST_MAG76-3378, partial [uncultured Acidimicrobiales bacterium]
GAVPPSPRVGVVVVVRPDRPGSAASRPGGRHGPAGDHPL